MEPKTLNLLSALRLELSGWESLRNADLVGSVQKKNSITVRYTKVLRNCLNLHICFNFCYRENYPP